MNWHMFGFSLIAMSGLLALLFAFVWVLDWIEGRFGFAASLVVAGIVLVIGTSLLMGMIAGGA